MNVVVRKRLRAAVVLGRYGAFDIAVYGLLQHCLSPLLGRRNVVYPFELNTNAIEEVVILEKGESTLMTREIDFDKAIRYVRATLGFEGLELTEEEEKLLKSRFEGKIKEDEYIQKALKLAQRREGNEKRKL